VGLYHFFVLNQKKILVSQFKPHPSHNSRSSAVTSRKPIQRTGRSYQSHSQYDDSPNHITTNKNFNSQGSDFLNSNVDPHQDVPVPIRVSLPDGSTDLPPIAMDGTEGVDAFEMVDLGTCGDNSLPSRTSVPITPVTPTVLVTPTGDPFTRMDSITACIPIAPITPLTPIGHMTPTTVTPTGPMTPIDPTSPVEQEQKYLGW